MAVHAWTQNVLWDRQALEVKQMSDLLKTNRPQLPHPVTTGEMFLAAIVYELRSIADTMATMAIPEPPAIVPDEPASDAVELREPEASVEVESINEENAEQPTKIVELKRRGRKAKA